ncbi:MAG: hypothetical protein JJE04_24635 [Acidobacteriia bacterium]|nr:hypothetical protein [Terriglobia bacterium]
METTRVMLALLALAASALAQAPVVFPRTVQNPLTLEPAPSRVTPGGLLVLRGINLGPAEEVMASGMPLPTKLADPAVEVLINNRAVPLFSVGPGRIQVQVPWQTAQGLATIVVRRGELTSRPTSVRIVNALPGLRSKNGLGFGEAAATTDGNSLKLSVTGLGPTDPQIPSGEPGPAEPRNPARAFVGGLPAATNATLSPDRVGEYDVTVEIPADARPGDRLSILAGNAAPGNRLSLGRADGAEMQWLPLPEDAGGIRVLRVADLRGNFVIASEARADDGCYPSWMFDLSKRQSSRIEPCLISPQPNAPSPMTLVNESGTLASFIGPATGDAQAGISSRVALFSSSWQEPVTVELPAAASNLAPQNGNVIAIVPSTPPTAYSIDAQTGEISEALTVGAGGGAAIPAGALIANYDLGDGIKEPLSPPMNLGPGRLAVVVGDDVNKPAKAKLALLNQSGELTDTRDFPEGWLPLIPPVAPPATPGPGGGPGGGVPPGPGGGVPPGPGGGVPPAPGGAGPAGQQARFRLPINWDPTTRTIFVLSSNSDGSAHSFTAFTGPELQPTTITLPSGWFVANCQPRIALFNLELSRRIALLGSSTAETEVKAACLSQAFLLLDIASQQITAVPLPGQGQINAASPAGDVNDYLFGTSSDGGNRNLADTLFVLDSVAGSAFRLNLPSGVTQFSGLQPIPELSALLAAATTRAEGDGGLVYFDLENETSRVLPIPEGFVSLNVVAVFDETRKVVARGNKAGGAGSQYLIYDLLNGDLLMPDNPSGVAHVGQLPALPGPGGGQGGQPQAPAQYQVVSAKSGFVTAVGFGEDRQPKGLLSLRVP